MGKYEATNRGSQITAVLPLLFALIFFGCPMGVQANHQAIFAAADTSSENATAMTNPDRQFAILYL